MRATTPLKVGGGLLAGAVVANQLAQARIRRYEHTDPSSIDLPGAMFYLRGLGLHFSDTGEPPAGDGGPPLLLLHGFRASTFMFRRQLPALAPRRRVLAVDLPGHGFSDRPTDRDLSFPAQAELLRELLDRLDIPLVITLGTSIGGGIAFHLAAAHPRRVTKIIAAAVAPDKQWPLPWYPVARPLLPVVAALLLATDRWTARAIRRQVYDAAALTAADLQGWLEPLRLRGTIASLLRLGADVRRQPTVDPATIRQRTLLLWGEADPTLPLPIAHDLHRRLPDARLEVIPRAGHLLLEEQPDACNDAILRFLSEPERPA